MSTKTKVVIQLVERNVLIVFGFIYFSIFLHFLAHRLLWKSGSILFAVILCFNCSGSSNCQFTEDCLHFKEENEIKGALQRKMILW